MYNKTLFGKKCLKWRNKMQKQYNMKQMTFQFVVNSVDEYFVP